MPITFSDAYNPYHRPYYGPHPRVYPTPRTVEDLLNIELKPSSRLIIPITDAYRLYDASPLCLEFAQDAWVYYKDLTPSWFTRVITTVKSWFSGWRAV